MSYNTAMIVTRRAFFLHLLFLWLWIGFTGGAGVLLLVATPIEERLTAAGMNPTLVNVLLSAVALAWVLLSGATALLLARRIRGRRAAILAHAAGILASAVVFAIFLQAGAGLFGRFRSETSEVSERFTFGPHPDRAQMDRLKAEGYTGILTLLSPFVPFEAILLEEERRHAGEAGITLIEASMLPWVSSNEKPLALIRELARADTGRYYVHCYLGRHRAELARHVILEVTGAGGATAMAEILPPRFDRGRLFLYGDTIAVGPLPTRDEWFEFLVRAGVRRVVALVDPVAEAPAWLADERQFAAASGVAFETLALDELSGGDSLLALVRRRDGRIYIHSFFIDERARLARRLIDPNGDYPKPTRAEESLDSRLDLPPLKPGALTLPPRLERGPVTIIGGRIGIGPLPTPEEWEDDFKRSTIRLIVSILNPEVPEDVPWINQERAAAARLGVGFLLVPVRRQSDILPVLGATRSVEGAIYVHGFGAEERIEWVRELLETTRPLPPRFERGPIVAADRVHFGPLPTSDEWKVAIARSTIRTVFLLLDPDDPGNEPWIDQVEADARLTGVRVVIPENLTDVAAVAQAIAKLAAGDPVYVLAFSGDDPILQRIRTAWRMR